MVSAANPYAARAAADALRAGGHAVDAAIAAHTVLSLVEPQSSGIGGGAFMLVYDRAQDTLVAYDGRETAPASVDAALFADANGEELGFVAAWQGGLSTGVPGSVAIYELAHSDHGRLPWADNFAAAARLATEGFEVSPRLAGFLPRIARFARLDENPGAAEYFFPNGEPLAAGSLRKNPAYATTLNRIASEGASAFYTGDIAREIVAQTNADPLPGGLTMADLANYRAQRRDAICAPGAGLRLCTAPPPASGVGVLMMAGLYDRLVPADADRETRLAAFVDAQRLAYADRDRYIGDPGYSAIPVTALLDPRYLDRRIEERPAPGAMPAAGDPGLALGEASLLQRFAADHSRETPSTTHLSIVDAAGNAVSLTASVEAPFGNSRWVGGFLLNNQLTDFRRAPDGKVHANAPAPGKRPRSSMSPIIGFDAAGQLRLVTGSPGGNSIPAYVAKSVLGVTRWGLSPQAAIDAPNIVARGERVRVETSTDTGKTIAAALKARGYDVQEREGENSGLHIITVDAAGLKGAADARREGIVIAVPDA